MIVSKNNPQTEAPSQAIGADDSSALSTHTRLGVKVLMAESYDINPMEDALCAIADILSNYLLVDPDGNIYVRKNEEVDKTLYKPLFRTVQVENGQIDRLIRTKQNDEGVIPLPGVFHHFTDMHWDVGSASIGTCKAIYRMKVVMNNLNIEDYDTQMYCYKVAQAIIRCFAAHVSDYSAFTTRFQLDYFDLMETWTKGIQYFWLQYSIYFRDYTTYAYRDYIEKHVVCPPFTNHSDQKPESNEDGHEDHVGYTYDMATKYTEPEGGAQKIPIHN